VIVQARYVHLSLRVPVNVADRSGEDRGRTSNTSGALSVSRRAHAAWRAGRWSEMTASGTNRTNRAGVTMSVDRGRPEVVAGRQTDANDPFRKSG
jgi:hypothetical protein